MKPPRLRSLGFPVLKILLAALLVAACDTGSSTNTTPGTGGNTGGTFTSPIFYSLNTGDENLCTGKEISLLGVNFSSILENNRVSFRFSDARIPGLPVRVEFPTDGNPKNGLESRLRVIVPTGVASGNVELEVNGTFAGAAGYFACPQIFSYAIGAQGDQPALAHSGPLGFDPQGGPTDVILFGINFEEVNQILVTDSHGNTASKIAPNMINLRPNPPNLPKNNLQAIGFNLKGTTATVQGQRDNLSVQLSNATYHSNVVQVPVQALASWTAGEATGAVINGAMVPTGVRTGPVRIHYVMYDHPKINQACTMDVEWTVDGGTTWYPAWPDVTDPEQYGVFSNKDGRMSQVLPGETLFGSPAGLFYGGGALRTFAWDAQNDDNFRAINNSSRPTGGANPRNFTISFRLHPIPEGTISSDTGLKKPGDTDHAFITPPVAYYDLQDRGNVSFADQRFGAYGEPFDTTARMDSRTTARWGPPFNPGELRGAVPASSIPQAGTGTFDLVLEKVDPVPDGFLEEYFVIETSLMRIDHVIAANDTATPPNRLETVLNVFPTLQNPNPGEALGEFHVRRLQVAEGVEIRLEGSRPAIFRVSGNDGGDLDVVVDLAGTIRANGEVGGAGGAAPGAGGRSRCGGGAGGAGATIAIADGLELTPAEDGGNDGGGGGETAAGEDANIAVQSKFLGAPGGGGGNSLAGGAGDPGLAKNPGNFAVPHGGRAGARRGSQFQVPLSTGSGGGGGGATIVRAANAVGTYTVNAGGGGGGAGGGIQITALGSMVITGRLEAKGASGGNGSDSGPGGGGSGGAILLQATGSIAVTCDRLDVAGGDPGRQTGQNQNPGSGKGSPGWIRVETRIGGGPYCGSLAFQSELTTRLPSTIRVSEKIQVKDATGFPTRGYVIIDNEVIAYRRVTYPTPPATAGSLEDISRAQRGTTIAEHNAPAKVILDAPVFPPEGLVEAPNGSQFAPDPDPILTGSGPDGVLHASWIETIDADTGLPMVDPDTGSLISLWTIDSDTGTVLNPNGSVILTTSAANLDPGLFALSRLKIDPNVILRAIGSRPLRILVSEIADIGGVLDLSGNDGGLLRFDATNPSTPAPGIGGRGGPGGGDGGDGGSMVFLDNDPTNKNPENIIPVPAQGGLLPGHFPAEYDLTGETSGSNPPPGGLIGLETTRATAGEPIRDQVTCGGTVSAPCSAGGGGGGGARLAGTNGQAKPATSKAFGVGGSAFGLDTFRFGGGPFLVGGQGGGGGGSSALVSPDYEARRAGPAIFQGAAKFGPGTGGGGGGGTLQLVVQGALVLRSTGKIQARGGSAYQSIDWAGNGGAGAGGSVLIQVANAFSAEPGARIDVSGGLANLAVPVPSGQNDPLYEGNIRRVGASTDLRDLGGRGGDGSIGRVRIEAPIGSNLVQTAFNESLSSGYLLVDTVVTSGISQIVPLGVGPGNMAMSHLLDLEPPILRFADQSIPDGTDAFILWEGGAPSLQKHGVQSAREGRATPPTVALPALGGSVDNILDLQDFEYVRFRVQILSNGISEESPTIDEVGVSLRLGDPNPDAQ